MKKLILVGGTMGVGKSSVCRALHQRLTPSVWLDGDWCWNLNPFEVTEETKAMAMDNIAHLLGKLSKMFPNGIRDFFLGHAPAGDHRRAFVPADGNGVYPVFLLPGMLGGDFNTAAGKGYPPGALTQMCWSGAERGCLSIKAWIPGNWMWGGARRRKPLRK